METKAAGEMTALEEMAKRTGGYNTVVASDVFEEICTSIVHKSDPHTGDQFLVDLGKQKIRLGEDFQLVTKNEVYQALTKKPLKMKDDGEIMQDSETTHLVHEDGSFFDYSKELSSFFSFLLQSLPQGFLSNKKHFTAYNKKALCDLPGSNTWAKRRKATVASSGSDEEGPRRNKKPKEASTPMLSKKKSRPPVKALHKEPSVSEEPPVSTETADNTTRQRQVSPDVMEIPAPKPASTPKPKEATEKGPAKNEAAAEPVPIPEEKVDERMLAAVRPLWVLFAQKEAAREKSERLKTEYATSITTVEELDKKYAETIEEVLKGLH